MTMVAFDTRVASGGAALALDDARIVRAVIANSRGTNGIPGNGIMSGAFSFEKVER